MTRGSNHLSTQSRQFKVTDQLPFVVSPQAEKPIVLTQLDILVTVVGLFAETTQIMHFENPNNRDLEGNLTFPLPDGGVVCGYGLDIDGVLVDGVVVPKQQARQILEAEERKGADPGLLEQVQGNIYQTRIYPIPAKGKRIIKLTYTSELTVIGSDVVYDLSLQHAETVDQTSLRIEVEQAPHKPVISGGQGNVTMRSWRQAWVAEALLKPGLITEDLQIRLPDLPDTLQMVQKTADGETFFSINHLLKEQPEQPEWRPNRIALAWDASGSRTNVECDITFLKKLFARWQDCLVDVQVFRNKIDDEMRSFKIQLGQSQELIDYLKAVPYDGATDLSLLDLSCGPNDATEAWLLFTDGLDTVQQELPDLGMLPVYPVVSDIVKNGPFLHHVAEKSGGVLIDLLRFAAEESCHRLCTARARPRVLKSSGCEDTRLMFQGGRIVISGRLTGEDGTVCLGLSRDEEHILTLQENTATEGNIIARQWAGQRIQELALLGKEKSEQTLALARRFGIVSPGTSLLVLESLEQYLEYGVEPPESLPGMRASFHEEKNNQNYLKKRGQKEHLESIVKLWNERVVWWEKDFNSLYKEKLKAREKPRETESRPVRHRRSVHNRVQPTETDMLEESEICYSLNRPELQPSGPRESDDSVDYCLEDLGVEGSGEPTEIPQLASGPTMSIKPWNPDRPYIDKIRKAEPTKQYSVFLAERNQNRNSPSFILDCGDYFLTSKQKMIGLRVLSNLLEMELEDVALMRIYARRLQQAGEFDEAIQMFERILDLRDDEPQSYRDLALALGDRWENGGEDSDAIRAMDFFYIVVLQEWDRFPEIEIIALMELNRLIEQAVRQGVPVPGIIAPQLQKLLDLDVRISLSWDADLTDVDLHVYEPTGEHASYSHNLTEIGGLVSRDFTEGYGPEEYVLRRAVPGVYQIKAHYYSSHRQSLVGPCTVLVNVFTNYGRSDEKKRVLTLRLEESGDTVLVGEIVIEEPEKTRPKPRPATLGRKVFRKIRLGMTMAQLFDLVGPPYQVNNDEKGLLVLVYRLPGRVEMQITMKYEVVSICQVMDGVVIDLDLDASDKHRLKNQRQPESNV